jgi:hypothetical protein
MAANPLLPDRHPTRDFFIPDIFDNLPVKDDMASMENPFFTLSTKPDHRTLTYKNGDKSVVVMPSSLGLPTIFDKDVLLYCGSQIMERLNRGEIPPKTLRISVNDFLVATNRPNGGDAYKRFKQCLIRLASCLVETTIKTGRTKQVKGFGLIESYAYLENEHAKRRLIGVELTLSDWFYNSLIAKEVLTIDRDYFRLRKPIERRVYEIARKHCGSKIAWDITLDNLYAKSGALSAIKHFRAAVKELAKHDHLPEYHVRFDRERDMVTFGKRGAVSEAIANDIQPDLFNTTEPKETLPSQIPPSLLEDVKNVVGIGLDYYNLWHQYINWSGSQNAKNARAGFIGFCSKKAGKEMRA